MSHTKHKEDKATAIKTQVIQNMHPPKMLNQVCAFLGLVVFYRKFIRNFAKIAKPLTLLTYQKTKLEWSPTHHNAFLMLKESVIKAQCYTIQIQRNIT